jgi:integrase/recombinase XerD
MPDGPVPVPEPGDCDSGERLLSNVVERFFVTRKPKKGSVHTERAYRQDLAAIAVHLAAATGADSPKALYLDQVTVAALRDAFAAYSVDHAEASISRAWTVWNQLFAFLVADDLVARNPMNAVSKPKVPKSEPKPLQGPKTADELLEKLAAGARQARFPWPQRDLAFIATALMTGMRLSELLALKLGSLDGRPGERRFKVSGKGRKERFVPIEAPLEALIDTYLVSRRTRFPDQPAGPATILFVDRHGKALRPGGAQYLVRQCYLWAGIGARVPDGALVHALRHSLATRLAEEGATATEIQHLLGHESLTTSQGYIDSTAREQRDAARANRTYRTLERIVAAQRKTADSSDEPIDTSDAQATPHDSAADTRT